eukprot:191571_1
MLLHDRAQPTTVDTEKVHHRASSNAILFADLFSGLAGTANKAAIGRNSIHWRALSIFNRSILMSNLAWCAAVRNDANFGILARAKANLPVCFAHCKLKSQKKQFP